jgi:hypothetical protein
VIPCLLLPGAGGCGLKAGAVMYHMFAPEQEVKAAYVIPEGPVIILVDDHLDLVHPPSTNDLLVDELAKQFKKHKIAERVTTNEEIARIRQQHSEFDKLSIREVGQLVGADTMVWINPQEYVLQPNRELAYQPGRFRAKLKVFNVRAEEKSDIRLWPNSPDGHLITAEINAQEIRQSKTDKEVYQKLTYEMADTIAKLFHDYRLTK